MREAGEVIVLLAFEEPVLIANVDVDGADVLVAFEEPVLITKVEFAGGEVAAAAKLEVVLPWRKMPPGVVLDAAYVATAVFVGSADTVVEITERGALVGNAGREDP